MKVSLKAARVNAELDQKTVCEAMNISPQKLIRIEKGESAITIEDLDKFCELYGCKRSDIRLSAHSQFVN